MLHQAKSSARTAAFVMLSALPVGAGEWAVLIPYEDPVSVAAGAAIYQEHCAACHGADREGAPNWRIRDDDGYMPAPPHDETGHTWHHPDTQLFVVVKQGIEETVGGGYQSRMTGFEGILTDAEIVQVLAYIKAQWPPRLIAIHNRMNADALEAEN